MLPRATVECGVVAEPELRFSGAGKAWASVRVVAKDRKRGDKGEWEDGDPFFFNVTVFGRQAENLVESVVVGDMIIVEGKFEENTWETKEGETRKDMRLIASTIGVSLLWNPAKTPKMLGEATGARPAAAKADPFAQDDKPPF